MSNTTSNRSASPAMVELEQPLIAAPEHRAADEVVSSTLSPEQQALLDAIDSGYRYYFRWASVDILLQKWFLQATLFHRPSVTSDKPLYSLGLQPQTRYTPLTSTWQLRVAYAMQIGVRFTEKVIFRGIKAFVATMLALRIHHWRTGSSTDADDFTDLFRGVQTNGLDNLVWLLAQVRSNLLIVMMLLPLLLGILRGIVASFMAKGLAPFDVDEVERHMHAYTTEKRLLHDVVAPFFPRGFSGKIEDMSDMLRWDGRLTLEQRQRYFTVLETLASSSHYYIQMVALRELARIAHGGTPRDIPVQMEATIRANIQEQRVRAIAILQNHHDQGVTITAHGTQRLWQYAYSRYLLWWLGLPLSLTQSLFFLAFKLTKLAFYGVLLTDIYASILKVLQCRRVPITIGEQIIPGAVKRSLTCFQAHLDAFRRIPGTNDTITAFVDRLPTFDLRRLTTLTLRYKQLTTDEAVSIVKAVIAQGAQLTNLELSGNNITHIPAEIWQTDNFRYLTTLDLSWNPISILPAQTFQKLSSLFSLDLRMLPLQRIDATAFHGLFNLHTLQIQQAIDQNTTIPLRLESFKELGSLQTLVLDGRYSPLPSQLLWPLTALRSFVLRGNHALSSLPQQFFRYTPLLKNLRIEFNLNLVRLPNDFLTYTPTLSNLALSLKNGYIPSTIFKNTLQLQEISLAGGGTTIFNISTDTFTKLANLRVLWINNIQIPTWPLPIFTDLTELTELKLNGLNLTTLPHTMLEPLHNLRSLDIESNQIASIDTFIDFLPPTLRQFYFGNNNIVKLPANARFRFPMLLKSINFDGNPFVPTTVTRRFLQQFPPSVTHLSIDHIDAINADALYDFPVLETFHFNFRSLARTTIPATLFERNMALSKISLRNVDASTLPKNLFSSLQTINELDLSATPGSSSQLPVGIFDSLSQMTLLTVNGFENFPTDDFLQLTSLKGVFILNTKITDLPKLTSLTSLETLVLHNNSLTDQSLINLSNGLPKNLSGLSLRFNPYFTEHSINTLQRALPCSQIVDLTLTDIGDKIRLDTTIQERILNDLCQDEICEALTITENCAKRTLTDSGSSRALTTAAAFNFFSPAKHKGLTVDTATTPAPIPYVIPLLLAATLLTATVACVVIHYRKQQAKQRAMMAAPSMPSQLPSPSIPPSRMVRVH